MRTDNSYEMCNIGVSRYLVTVGNGQHVSYVCDQVT